MRPLPLNPGQKQHGHSLGTLLTRGSGQGKQADSVSRPVRGWHSPEPKDTTRQHARKEGTETKEQACKGSLVDASDIYV